MKPTPQDEEKSRQLELRREQAERELAEARARQLTGHPLVNHNLDIEDDEDDTYNNMEMPHSPRDNSR